jgi:histidyl-tRNA synthetase
MTLRAVKGMNDILPGEAERWHRVEDAFRRSMDLSGFREVRTPLVEPTPLFVRAIGDTTDVVEKEMYSFTHHDEPLTLRPEGTAGAVRAYVEHKVHNAEPVSRWYYLGPMYRGERPAKGRYRQFYQAGAEIFGDPGPGCDAELIVTLVDFLRAIGVSDARVLLNSIGSGETRAKYKEALVAHLAPKRESLSEESKRRLEKNPLRILDSKDPRDRDAAQGAPSIADCMTDEDLAHFAGLKAHLDALGVPYKVDPRLVRGLDYYTRTLFEIKGASDKLGAGDTLVGGGRYDGMVEDLGGPSVPAIGFAAGVERLLIASSLEVTRAVADVLVAPIGAPQATLALVLARELRALGVRTEADLRGASPKALLRRANALGARFALLLGEREAAAGVVQLKDLAGHEQTEVPRDAVARVVLDRIGAAT